MYFINKNDRAGCPLYFLDHGFEPFFKVTTVTGACKQCAHVQLEDDAVCQHLGDLTMHYTAGKPFSNCGFTHTRVPHKEWIVFLAAAEYLDCTVNFRFTANERVDPPFACFFVKIDTEIFQHIRFTVCVLAALNGGGIIVNTPDSTCF